MPKAMIARTQDAKHESYFDYIEAKCILDFEFLCAFPNSITALCDIDIGLAVALSDFYCPKTEMGISPFIGEANNEFFQQPESVSPIRNALRCILKRHGGIDCRAGFRAGQCFR